MTLHGSAQRILDHSAILERAIADIAERMDPRIQRSGCVHAVTGGGFCGQLKDREIHTMPPGSDPAAWRSGPGALDPTVPIDYDVRHPFASRAYAAGYIASVLRLNVAAIKREVEGGA